MQKEGKKKKKTARFSRSIITEWPKTISGLTNADRGSATDDASVEIDFAPLIHRARNVVKCRTPHPTMRVR